MPKQKLYWEKKKTGSLTASIENKSVRIRAKQKEMVSQSGTSKRAVQKLIWINSSFERNELIFVFSNAPVYIINAIIPKKNHSAASQVNLQVSKYSEF